MNVPTALLSRVASVMLARRAMASSSSLLESLLAGLMAVAILALLATLLIGFLIVGALFVGHDLLMQQGFTYAQSSLVIGGLVAFMLLVVAGAALQQLRKIKSIPKQLIMNEVPGVSLASNVIGSFMDGFRRG